MPRTLTPGMTTAITAEKSEFCLLIELDFSGGSIYLTNASHDISWNSITWTAVGGNVTYASFTETADLSSAGMEITVSGVNQSIIAILLTQYYIGRAAKVYRAHFTAGGAVVADPLLLFSGWMNGGWSIEEERPDRGGGTVTIRGRLQDRIGTLAQTRGIRPNTGSHQQFFPGDTFFATTGQVSARPVIWKKGNAG